MSTIAPPNSDYIQTVLEERLAAAKSAGGTPETVTIDWRDRPLSVFVVRMPVELLYYNPDTHRIRAQRTVDLARDKVLTDAPFSKDAQDYLHHLLKGDPTDPTETDPAFEALKEDLKNHGQREPGIVTLKGVLVNGNTRQAALRELGQKLIAVGVLPPDASHDDTQEIELALQLRKDHRRDYSFMNELLAIEERAIAGALPADIQKAFRIKAPTYERSRWILEFIRDAISRSTVAMKDGRNASLRLVDFERHQGKLEELFRAWYTLRKKAPQEAEALREQRLLALLLDKSKTDLRLIDQDFVSRFMKPALPTAPATPVVSRRIPGLSIEASGPSNTVTALRALTTDILRARAISTLRTDVSLPEVASASGRLQEIGDQLDAALDLAGRQARLIKRRFGPAERLGDACDDLELAVAAIAEARATETFNAVDLDESLLRLREHLSKLAALVSRVSETDGDGITWLRSFAEPGPY